MYAFHMQPFAQTRHALAKMHKHAAIPLLRAADGEGGYVERGQHLFGSHPGADEAATRLIALKLASHLMLALPHSAEKGAIKKITAQNERDLHPLFPREAAQNSLGKGGKRENQKITAQNERDLHPISGKSGNCPPWWMKAEGIAQRFRIPHERASSLERRIQPFVWIHGN